MKIKFLGTAAAEGVPAVFCSCETCKKAAKLRAKNIRTRSQALIDDKILIDFPADSYWHSIQYGIDLSKIGTVLFTHTHGDHFYTGEFEFRQKYFSDLKDSVPLHVYASEDFEKDLKKFDEKPAPYGVEYHKINAFEPFEVENGYRITALKARHGEGDPHIFLIEYQGKALLYAHDTGTILPETYDYLKKNNIKLDMLSLDCTAGNHPRMGYDTHMSVVKNVALTEQLRADGLFGNDGIVCVNHFSHNGRDILQEDMERAVAPYGYLVAYDGMEVEF